MAKKNSSQQLIATQLTAMSAALNPQARSGNAGNDDAPKSTQGDMENSKKPTTDGMYSFWDKKLPQRVSTWHSLGPEFMAESLNDFACLKYSKRYMASMLNDGNTAELQHQWELTSGLHANDLVPKKMNVDADRMFYFCVSSMQEVAGEKPVKRCKTVASVDGDGDDVTSASGSKHQLEPLPRRPSLQQQQLEVLDDEDVLLVTYDEETKMVDRLPLGVEAFVRRVRIAFGIGNVISQIHLSRVWQGELIDIMDNDSFTKLKAGTKLIANCVRSVSTDSSIASTASREHEKSMLAIQNGTGEQQGQQQPTTPRCKRTARVKRVVMPTTAIVKAEIDHNVGMLTTSSVSKIASALVAVAPHNPTSTCSSISTRKVAVPPAKGATSNVADAIASLCVGVKVEQPTERAAGADNAVGGEEEEDDEEGEEEEEEEEAADAIDKKA